MFFATLQDRIGVTFFLHIPCCFECTKTIRVRHKMNRADCQNLFLHYSHSHWGEKEGKRELLLYQGRGQLNAVHAKSFCVCGEVRGGGSNDEIFINFIHLLPDNKVIWYITVTEIVFEFFNYFFSLSLSLSLFRGLLVSR